MALGSVRNGLLRSAETNRSADPGAFPSIFNLPSLIFFILLSLSLSLFSIYLSNKIYTLGEKPSVCLSSKGRHITVMHTGTKSIAVPPSVVHPHHPQHRHRNDFQLRLTSVVLALGNEEDFLVVGGSEPFGRRTRFSETRIRRVQVGLIRLGSCGVGLC